MWRLFHKLFGWEYVTFQHGHGWRVFRVYRTPLDNRPYADCYGDFRIIKDNKLITGESIGRDVIWLAGGEKG